MNNLEYRIINKLINSKDDVWFIFIKYKKDTIVHISINNETSCHSVTRNIYNISKKPPYSQISSSENELKICYICLYSIDTPKHYVVSWRCNCITTSNKRCVKNTGSAYENFCIQHKNILLKKLNLYFSNDVSNHILTL